MNSRVLFCLWLWCHISLISYNCCIVVLVVNLLLCLIYKLNFIIGMRLQLHNSVLYIVSSTTDVLFTLMWDESFLFSVLLFGEFLWLCYCVHCLLQCLNCCESHLMNFLFHISFLMSRNSIWFLKYLLSLLFFMFLKCFEQVYGRLYFPEC